ncbi:putative nuclease of restriction endonuclease-like (RecB) superfamily [Arthrobacter sp. V4I6]|nr:putative nuclease of restriction endonuclease-like (RecB) superfamily [Arthrobacter sp. V1I7]MDQ0853581.1 putative nuclease of restriction endonuclease-like (RecB) superfamily [Arthrobacter sp. V4I6]
MDLLFFHIEQSRYVVIELKTGKFQPEYAGYAQLDVMPKSSFVLAC